MSGLSAFLRKTAFKLILICPKYSEKQEMDEDSEKSAIEDLPVVSSVRFHAGDKTHKSGVYANLRCGCGAKQVGPVRKSRANVPLLVTAYVNLDD
jgi:hypothetical protein